MNRFFFVALLAAFGFASPLAGQAQIAVTATIAEPVRAPDLPSLRVDYHGGRYLDVTTPAAVQPGGYLVEVVVAGAAPAGERGSRYRVDLGPVSLPRRDPVAVTYVIAANL